MSGDGRKFWLNLPASLAFVSALYLAMPIVPWLQRDLLGTFEPLYMALYLTVYIGLPVFNLFLVYRRSLWFLGGFLAHTSLLFVLLSQMMGLGATAESQLQIVVPPAVVPWVLPIFIGALVAAVFGGVVIWLQDLLPPFLSKSDRYWRKAIRTAGNKPLTIETDEGTSPIRLVTEDVSRTGIKVFGDTNQIEQLNLEPGERLMLYYNNGGSRQYLPVVVRWTEAYGPFVRFGVSFDLERGHTPIVRMARGVTAGRTFQRSSQFWAINGARYATLGLWLAIMGLSSGMPACGTQPPAGPDDSLGSTVSPGDRADPRGFALAGSQFQIEGTIEGCDDGTSIAVTLPQSDLTLPSALADCQFYPAAIDDGDATYERLGDPATEGSMRFRTPTGEELTLIITANLPSPLGEAPQIAAKILRADLLPLLTIAQGTVPLPVAELAREGPFEVDEADTSHVTFAVTLSDPALADLSLVITASGPAEAGLDFILDSIETDSNQRTLTIPAGEDSIQFAVEILDDSLVESAEALLLEIAPNPALERAGQHQAGLILRANDAVIPTAGLALNLDAAQGVVTDSEGLVDRWSAIAPAASGVSATASADSRPVLDSEARPGMAGLQFDGLDDSMLLPNSTNFNEASFYEHKTIQIAFATGADTNQRQMIFEQGGTTRGLNFYIDAGRVYLNAYNLSRDGNPAAWGPLALSEPVQPSTAYVATLALDAPNGKLHGYINGQHIGELDGAMALYQHSGGLGLGGINGNTYYHDGGSSALDPFEGTIFHMQHWNATLTPADVLSSYQLSWEQHQPATVIASIRSNTTELIEGAGPAEITVALDRPHPTDLVFQLARSGTADLSEWQLDQQSLTLPAFTQQATLTLTTNDDSDTESPESMIVSLSSAADIAMGQSTVQWTLIDDDSFYPTGEVVGWWPAPPADTGDPVQAWSAGSTELVQSNTGKQPQSSTVSASDPRTCVAFDGLDDQLTIANSAATNDGGPYDEKFFSIEFRTGDDITRRQVLFEEGGTVRGFNIYIEQGQIYGGAWNLANDDGTPLTPWGGFYFHGEAQPNTVHRATIAYSAIQGVVEFYLDDALVGTQDENVGRLYRHTGGIGLGAVNNDTLFHSGSASSGENFAGCVISLLYQNSVPSKPAINLLHQP